MKIFGYLVLAAVSTTIPFAAAAQELINPVVGQPEGQSSLSLMPPSLPGSGGGGVAPSMPSGSQTTLPAKPEPLPAALQDRHQAESLKPQVRHAWMRPSGIGKNGAVYMQMIGGAETDVLKSISTAWADRVEIHQTVIDDQGVARMSELPELPVAEEAKIDFVPRGMHVMVMGLKRDLSPGQIFPLFLNFEKAGEVRVMVSIRATEDGMADMPMQHEQHHADMPMPAETAPATSMSPTPEVSMPAPVEHAH